MIDFTSIKNIRKFMLSWNQLFPVDKWWRTKHNIPFNSKEHRSTSIIDMYIEYSEELYFSSSSFKSKKENFTYIPGEGNFLKEKIYTKEEIDKAFDEMDIENID